MLDRLRQERPLLSPAEQRVADYVLDNPQTVMRAAVADIARQAGAFVLERNDAERRGKGHALDFAFRSLADLGYSWFIVIDADSVVSRGFLAAMRQGMQHQRNAVQASYLSRPARSLRGRLVRFAQFGFNHIRPLGRSRLGVSAGLFGNGFALRAQLLEKLPYRAHSVVEDLEYHLDLVSFGEQVHFVPEALVLGEIAESAGGAASQRTRWEGGRLRILRERSAGLLRDLLQGKENRLEVLSDLLLLPLGLHVALLLAGLAGGLLGKFAAGFGGLALLLYIAAIFLRAPARRSDCLALAAAPFYVLWKLSLLPATLLNSRRSANWVRAERAAEQKLTRS